MNDKTKFCEFGTENPTLMDNPFWKRMVCDRKESGFECSSEDVPEWSFARFGITYTYLPDGRLICIGGEHEDPNGSAFFIYNDVVVIKNPQVIEVSGLFVTPIPSNFPISRLPQKRNHRKLTLGTLNENNVTIYGYPKDVFPPTDFHSATYVRNDDNSEFIYIIGGVGYINSIQRKQTQVYRLHLSDFSIHKFETTGEKPEGCTQHHNATLQIIEGRRVIQIENRLIVRNRGASRDRFSYELDIESGEWKTWKLVSKN